MGYFSAFNEPIKISKYTLPVSALTLSILAHGISPYAREKFTDDHTHPAEYPMEDAQRFNTMVSSTTSATSVTPLILFNADGSTQILNP